MMAHLVSDDIGLGKFGLGSAESLFQLLEKGGIEVDRLIRRAIKRSDRGGRRPASCFHPLGEKHHVRWLIALVRLAKLFVPNLLGETEDSCRELVAAFLLRRQGTF